jgi:hypothetical protein
VTVNVNPLPTVTTSGNTAICMGSSTSITASGANTYVWMPGNMSGSNVTVNPTTTTTYTVTGTSSAGCTGTASVSVIVNNLPSVTYLQSPTNVCINWQVFGLSTANPQGGVYSGTGVNGTNFDPAVAGVGTHTVTYTYTDINGCSNSAAQQITVNACAGVNDLSAPFSLETFPNPFSEELNVIVLNAEGKISAGIFDLLGEELISVPASGNGSFTVNTSGLSSGFYLLQVKAGNSVVVKKLLKE